MEAADTQSSRSAPSHSTNIGMRTSLQEGDQISELFEASERGDVSTLESLIDKNPQILHKLSLAPFAQTPLHISSSLGHLEFTKKLLSHRSGSELALERDYNQRTALHLASAQGYIHIVRELVDANKQPCLFADEEKRIPLHYAAMRGRKEVVQMLIRAEPDSIRYRDNENNNAFHLCVLNNQLETLKVLVDLEREFDLTGELVNFTGIDHCGNTVLHLTMELKQVETIKYLLSEPKIRQIARLQNKYGFTAQDILEHSPKVFKTLEIWRVLISNGIEAAETKRIDSIRPSATHITSTEECQVELPSKATQEKGLRKILWICFAMIFGKNKEEDTSELKKRYYLEEMRGNLSVVAVMITTITFQALINPPGGFVQQGVASHDDQKDPFQCLATGTNNTGSEICPGDAVSGVSFDSYFGRYLKFNAISFIGSLCVTLLLVSGIPLKHRSVIWALTIGVCITLTFLSLTYLEALYMVTPDGYLFDSTSKMVKASLITWIAFLVFVAVFVTLRFLFWLSIMRRMKKFNRQLLTRPRNGIDNI